LSLAAIVVGFGLLVKSADEAILRLVRISHRLGVSQFAVSFIFVGIVAALPELSIALNSALQGTPSLGLGVIFSSNSADLSLVIGMVALVAGGIKMGKPLRNEALWLPLAAALPPVLLLDGELSRLDGVLLLGAFAAYLWHLRAQKGIKLKHHSSISRASLGIELGWAMFYLAVLMGAGWLITEAAQNLGLMFSAPLLFIGALLAIGTCLPELTFAIKASNHHHSELGLGNILGNVITDCLGGLGLLAVIHPVKPDYPALALLDGFFVVLVMAFLMVALRKGGISRMEGAGLIVLYLVFLAVQVVSEQMFMVRVG
ncbi:MAG: hypothetical protein M1530_00765, partial [Candidatus Marsarchaeota archaeon]|nr:hypothetical protein [Candidatus Marsarchaeota archaeon]